MLAQLAPRATESLVATDLRLGLSLELWAVETFYIIFCSALFVHLSHNFSWLMRLRVLWITNSSSNSVNLIQYFHRLIVQIMWHIFYKCSNIESLPYVGRVGRQDNSLRTFSRTMPSCIVDLIYLIWATPYDHKFYQAITDMMICVSLWN